MLAGCRVHESSATIRGSGRTQMLMLEMGYGDDDNRPKEDWTSPIYALLYVLWSDLRDPTRRISTAVDEMCRVLWDLLMMNLGQDDFNTVWSDNHLRGLVGGMIRERWPNVFYTRS
jgi:hypothetical protein